MLSGLNSKNTLSAGIDYNQRLFSKGLRKWLHLSRFYWLERRVKLLPSVPENVLEIGCYDGRSLEYLTTLPKEYLGYDADWEEALSLARQRWSGHDNLKFCKSTLPEHFVCKENHYDIAIGLETLEHITPDDLDEYLKKIHLALKTGGTFFVSVPVEIGPVFAVKQILKWVFIGDADKYSFKEYCCQIFGMVDHVKRMDHKGFSYRRLKKQLKRHFQVETVEGIPMNLLPPYVNFGCGIVCRKV